MMLQEIMQEIRRLDIDDRKLLISWIVDSLSEPPKKYSILDFEGVGAHLYDGQDAQQRVNEMRDEWDDHS
ncbi:MAG: hypothetical protein K8L97_12875 [Anaerolineae bacterium]|nr:hypothetical protein [Anaerolineae bacterium]